MIYFRHLCCLVSFSTCECTGQGKRPRECVYKMTLTGGSAAFGLATTNYSYFIPTLTGCILF